MKKLRQLLALTLGLGLLAAALSLFPNRPVSAQGPPSGVNVNVLNTPLPVTGSLGVSGMVQAQQSGTWNVGISNANTSPVPVRDVENPARQPFQVSMGCNFVNDSCNVGIEVPPSKRFVIEAVTADLAVQPGLIVLLNIETVSGGAAIHHLTLTSQGTFGLFERFVSTNSLRLYADSGGSIRLSATRNTSSGSGSGDFTVSGYLVDCGAGPGCPIP